MLKKEIGGMIKMNMKKWALTTIAASALVVSLAACSTGSKKEEATGDKKQVLKVLESAELPTMDISQATDVVSFSAISQVMEGLYEFADDSTSAPAIAKEVVAPTNDGKKYTIELRDDAKWSNGDPVTAKDFVYSWKRTVDPKTGSEYAYLFDGFENYKAISKGEKPAADLGVKAVDDHTLEINLEYPIPYLSSLLAKPTFYPLNEKFVEEKGKDYGTNSENMIYNGPFTLADWDGTSITWNYMKNDKYRDADKVKLDEVNVQVSKEIGTNVNLFKAGETDIAPIKGEYVDQEKENPELVTRIYPSTSYLQYNTENKVFANKNARNAITKLINSDQIAKNILKDACKIHKCYYKDVKKIRDENIKINALCHITGGGLIDNPVRVLPSHLGINFYKNTWKLPDLFQYIQNTGNIDNTEMYKTFNCGIGLLIIVSPNISKQIIDLFPENYCFQIGEVIKSNPEQRINFITN